MIKIIAKRKGPIQLRMGPLLFWPYFKLTRLRYGSVEENDDL